MPSFKKKALSLFMRSGCQRQLRLYLYSDEERKNLGLPPRQKSRAGLGLAGQLGYEWQEEKVSELAEVFGDASIVEGLKGKNGRSANIPLHQVIQSLKPYQFVVEAEYDANSRVFREAMGFDDLTDEFGNTLNIAEARPDLIQVFPARIDAVFDEPIPYQQEVQPDGTLTMIPVDDTRLRLRVIDIKLAAEPGANYFAEVVYYAMTLSAWLHDNGYVDKFVIIAASAVWPGKYEASALVTERQKLIQRAEPVTLRVLAASLEIDIELVPFEMFSARLRRFFQDGLPELLATPWTNLPWHVNYACNGCEFLGYPWLKDGKPDNDPLHCWPTAEVCDHLSRVAGLSRGNARQLGVPAMEDLANLATDAPIFERSPTLRAQRTRLPGRAKSLKANTAGILPDAGSDALMPKWPALHIYVFIDYDLSSAITATFALRAFWTEPTPFDSTLEAQKKAWNRNTKFQEVFIVGSRELDAERTQLLKFLRALRGIMKEVQAMDRRDIVDSRRKECSSYQIYLWDEAQRRHLQRVVGRHLSAVLFDAELQDLAWLFPPPELLSNPEEASIRSPFTLVSRVVQNTVAVPLPHHYTLFGVARLYHAAEFEPPQIHPLYREPLSDLIPGERIHELWTKRGDWAESVRLIKQTAEYKLLAMGTLVTQLERDLKPVLNVNRLAAPILGTVRSRLIGLPPLSLLLYEFTRLNAALQDLESYTVRAMPAHEREARFRSAHLTERLEGQERIIEIVRLSQLFCQTISTTDETLVYRLAPNSRDLNARSGGISNFALAPRTQPAFLQTHPFPLTQPLYKVAGFGAMAATIADSGLTSVSIQAIDRTNGLIILKHDKSTHLRAADKNDKTEYTLEDAGFIDLSKDVMLDPIETDYLTKKVRLTLQGIGYPEIAWESPAMRMALGLPTGNKPILYSPSTPAAHFLWNGSMLATTVIDGSLGGVRNLLEPAFSQLNQPLNKYQWEAWDMALCRRLSLIWGPPGTGKSHTLRAIVAGALIDANRRGIPLRILVSANNYAAMDNILKGLPRLLSQVLPDVTVPIFRIVGRDRPADEAPEGTISVIAAAKSASPDVLDLKAVLNNPTGLVVVGAIPHQAHNLAVSSKNKTGINKDHIIAATQQPWFDLTIIDEASQMDVASALLVVSKATTEGAFVLAGDDLQLPPIHQAEPPKDLERYVGSVFEYARHIQHIEPTPLNVNYRSNHTIVDFFRTAGYDPRLTAFNPDLRLSLFSLPANEMPTDWPDTLAWSANWVTLLDPAYPATAFIHSDDTSGQVNDFEADAVTALVWVLYNRMHRQLLHELNVDGSTKESTEELCDADTFWDRAVGIVTPHKAQMSKIVSRLQAIFPYDNQEKIRAAVDTVERFQGQERDLIIASFGVGDPDLIQAEDEFLYNLRRFNVLVSRARAKLIVLCSQSLVDHLSNDSSVLKESGLLKGFVETFCVPVGQLVLPYKVGGIVLEQHGVLKRK